MGSVKPFAPIFLDGSISRTRMQLSHADGPAIKADLSMECRRDIDILPDRRCSSGDASGQDEIYTYFGFDLPGCGTVNKRNVDGPKYFYSFEFGFFALNRPNTDGREVDRPRRRPTHPKPSV